MRRLSLNGTKMAAKQHQTHFLPIQQSPTERLLPGNNPGWKPWLSLCVPYANSHCGRTGFHHIQDSQVWRCGLREGQVAKGNMVLTSRGNTGQTRQIKHRCPLRLASRMCQRAAFIFYALLSLAEKIARVRMDREGLADNRWFQHILQVLTHSQALRGDDPGTETECLIWDKFDQQ